MRDFAAKNDKQVLYVLSYSLRSIAAFIRSGRRLDQAVVDYLRIAELPYVDLLDVHAAEASRMKGEPEEALA